MEQIVARVRQLRGGTPLRDISDALLLALLAQSEYLPDIVNTGTILFERGEAITHWYLLLSGEVELYVSYNSDVSVIGGNGRFSPLLSSHAHPQLGRNVVRLRTLGSGAIFGELSLSCHSCSARVRLGVEFVRIPQSHFLSLYNKHADRLQPYILVMEDLVVENANFFATLRDSDTHLAVNNFVARPQNHQHARHQEHLHNPGKALRKRIENGLQPIQALKGELDDARTFVNTNVEVDTDSKWSDKAHFSSGIEKNVVAQQPPLAQILAANLFELNTIVPLEARVQEAALLLKRTMQLRSPWLIGDHRTQTSTAVQDLFPNSMLGFEMTRWLGELCAEIFSASHTSAESPDDTTHAQFTNLHKTLMFRNFGTLQLIAIWQALLDSQHIRQVNFERHFKDKSHMLYQWTVHDPLEAFYQSRANFYFNSVASMLRSASCTAAYASHLGWGAAASALFNGRLLPSLSNTISAATNFDTLLFCGAAESVADEEGSSNDEHDPFSRSQRDVCGDGDSPPNLRDLQSAVFLLSSLGLDSLLKVILCKPSHERTPAELELVYEELLHVKAFSHLSSMVKRELARVIRFEQYAHSGTVLFKQGEPGDSWFIIWRCGSVDVSILGKGVICILHEGDDFGKLALVNDAPRAATVTLRDDNSQFLRVDKHDFNRILRDVEANTVRLKEHGEDVLVLERISQKALMNRTTSHNPYLQSTSASFQDAKQQCCYSMMAGIPEKMVEYLLETRVDPVSIYAVPFATHVEDATKTADVNDNRRQKRHSGSTTSYEIFAATDALTRSCCIDYSELPLRYADDEAVATASASYGGYASDGNMNYCNNISTNLPYSPTMSSRRRKPIHCKKATAPPLTANTIEPSIVFMVENLDSSLEDFVLTHIIFMPSNVLCNYLKTYYNRRRQLPSHSYSNASALPLPPQLNPQNNRGLISPNGGHLTESDLEDLHEQSAAKRRVVTFLIIWQYVLGLHFFLDPVANSFVEEIYCCVLEDVNKIPNMKHVAEQMEQLRQLREYAMTIITRHPSVILDCGVYSAHAPAPDPVLPTDTCNQCIYLADTTFVTMDVRLDKSAAEIASMARAKIRRQRRVLPRSSTEKITATLQQQRQQQQLYRQLPNGFQNGASVRDIQEELSNFADTSASTIEPKSSPEEISDDTNEKDLCFLVEVKSNGERVVYSPSEVSVPTMLSLNGRLYVIFAEEIDSLVPLTAQDGPTQSVHHSVLELLRSRDIAQQLVVFHTQLFNATDEIELIFQVIGRDQFPSRTSCNLDLLLRRFNEVQYWTSTEVLLAPSAAKRFNVLKKFIKIAAHSKQMGDLMSVFAITLGLSNVAVSRLTHLWMKLPAKLRRQYAEFEALLDPSRNHRAYRLLVAKLNAPIVPFVPLLLKDLTFMHEGNKTSFSGLVNFEKMHMIANVLRNFRNCKASKYHFGMLTPKKKGFQGLIRNFRVIDNQRRLMELSYDIEPTQSFPAQSICTQPHTHTDTHRKSRVTTEAESRA